MLTAPAIGTPDAYRINKETIAAYKATLQNGTADNKIINDLTAASPDLAAVSSDLESEGVSKPTKFKEIGGAVNGLIISSNGVLSTISSLRAELMAFVDKATQSVDFLTKLGDDLGKGGRREIDKLQKRLTVLDGADLSAIDPHTRAIVEDAISKLASVTPDGDAQGLLQSLPPDQKRQGVSIRSAHSSGNSKPSWGIRRPRLPRRAFKRIREWCESKGLIDGRQKRDRRRCSHGGGGVRRRSRCSRNRHVHLGADRRFPGDGCGAERFRAGAALSCDGSATPQRSRRKHAAF